MDYDSVAEEYARNRKANASVVAELLMQNPLGPESKVLEVGCGPASYLLALIDATGCRGLGLEPSREMRGHAPNHDHLEILGGKAEILPFDGEHFDLVFSVNVIHHLEDRTAYFREAKRVLKPNGMVCTVTDSTEMIRNRKPLSQYWPSSAEADLKRYPSVDELIRQMTLVGLTGIQTRDISSPFLVTDSIPYRDKSFSCLHLISEEDFQIGLQRLEADLRRGPVEGLSEYVCIWGKPPGEAFL